jgi:hypothetical protein
LQNLDAPGSAPDFGGDHALFSYPISWGAGRSVDPRRCVVGLPGASFEQDLPGFDHLSHFGRRASARTSTLFPGVRETPNRLNSMSRITLARRGPHSGKARQQPT